MNQLQLKVSCFDRNVLMIVGLGLFSIQGIVNSYICDLELGEDDWRVNDYLHQLDTCFEVRIQKQKEHLSVEQLEAKVVPLCVHDFGLIVVPLVRLYLRVSTDRQFSRERCHKEATLAELALDSKKGTGNISKHSNDKLKDKKRTRNSKKMKDSRGTSTGDLHVSSHNTVSKASSTPPKLDEQPSDSDVETDVVLHQQEEQHKSSSRVTPTGNPVDDEWKPFRLEPIKQNNGARSPPENRLCNAKDGYLERTGTDSLITHNALLVFCETW
ncbi:hypothetical protein CTI12_AA386590 [Artemisia annua]|uniref:Uncharacterized protein n=1 Tax=Artemisia annua TaxID=35608 RepID=A0A2U1MFD4_ARTAN|nr:hypothetical protein CTI12_AA386590 [Artemisia annua]